MDELTVTSSRCDLQEQPLEQCTGGDTFLQTHPSHWPLDFCRFLYCHATENGSRHPLLLRVLTWSTTRDTTTTTLLSTRGAFFRPTVCSQTQTAGARVQNGLPTPSIVGRGPTSAEVGPRPTTPSIGNHTKTSFGSSLLIRVLLL